ncbi:MAG: protein kinase [Gemmatimonadota bacterium]
MTVTDLPAEVLAALSLRFQITGELGRGGMGTVVQGHDRELGREVAIKLLPLTLSRALGADRFAQEIRLTARLVHPNIVPLFTSGDAAGSLYYVMPLIEGMTLRRRLADVGPLPCTEVRRILADLAEALAYAHASGVVHRDLKPENIFWYQERALLADFGIARPLGQPGRERLTETGMVVGTLDYISPEQADGTEDIDGRSDLYSLGCVAFELLTGRPPFAGRGALATIAAHLTAPVPDVRERRADVPPRLAELLQRLMAKNCGDRPATGVEVLQELRAFDDVAAPAPIPAVPNPNPPESKLPAEIAKLLEQGKALFSSAVQGGSGARGKLELAKVYFEKAIARAPDTALALVGLSDVVHVMGVRGFADLTDSIRQARDLRLRALAIDDGIGELHSSIGVTCLYWDDEFDLAGVELRRGVELNPTGALGRRHFGAWLKIAGRLPEALKEMRAAVTLAPDAPFMPVGLADILMALGRYDEARGPLREALRLSPNYDAALERLEMSCHRAGLHEEALDARRSMLGVRGETARLQTLMDEVATIGWPAAREADLRRELAQLLARAKTEDPFHDVAGSRQLADKLVIVLAELGEWSQAMDWVEQGYHRRPGRLRRVLMDLPYNPRGLAVDPRYARLLRTAGLGDLI